MLKGLYALLLSMNRRQFLQSSGLGVSTALLSGCLSSFSPSSNSPAQSGSGHPCDNPRNIDYQAVDEYRDQGVYLKNSNEAAHTACVTVTKEHRDREETATSSPPLERMGYAVQPEMAVEIFTFEESGRYTIEVSIEETTKSETFEKAEAAFNDEKTKVTTFEITAATNIQVTYSGGS